MLDCLVVGGGLGGYATAIALRKSGHNVRILERNRSNSELGSCISVAPNGGRIMRDEWNIWHKFQEKGATSTSGQILRWDNGKLIGLMNPTDIFGLHHQSLRRTDYLEILHEGAVEAGAQIQFGAKVDSVDLANVSVTLSDGTKLSADLIVACDGVKSLVRSTLFPSKDYKPKASTSQATTWTLDAATILADPLTKDFLEVPNQFTWFGPNTASLAFPVQSCKALSVIVDQLQSESPDDSFIGAFGREIDLVTLRRTVRETGFEMPFCRLVDMAENAFSWGVSELPKLPTWHSENHRVVLLGDAAHASLPHCEQGSSQAIEDAATLGLLLPKETTVDDLVEPIKRYEAIRKPRTERLAEMAREAAAYYYLADGPAQEARDAELKEASRASGETARPAPDEHAPYFTAGGASWVFGWDVRESIKRST